MKTKSKKNAKKSLNANDLRPVYDLFGEIPVTHDEIKLWCERVTFGRVTPECRFYEHYVRGYDVANKIRRVKAYIDLHVYLGSTHESFL